MLKAVIADGQLTFESSVRGIAIYLDTFALKSLAKGDGSIRRRFVAAINGGADLLFSTTNAVEISGATGSSSEAVKAFLNELGPNWYPIEMLADKVMAREERGLPPDACCIDKDLIRAFFSNRTCAHTPGSGRIIDLSSDFFQLGAFVDWLAPQRNHFLEQKRRFDELLKDYILKLRAKHKEKPDWLDQIMPQPQFSPAKAATFAYWGLLRGLIRDRGHQVKDGDAMDFHHAVMACGFANFAALDKHWKSRVANLPKPNRTPRIYYEPELTAMVADIESGLSQLRNSSAMRA
ncbi:MAG: hypothetical protein WBE44_06355 [Terriglobales bacterium]|jgi:hypothetical protein